MFVMGDDNWDNFLFIKHNIRELLFQKILVMLRKSRSILVFISLASKNVNFAHVWSVRFFRTIETPFPSYQNHGAVREPTAIVYA